MYLPEAFAETRPGVLAETIARHPLATFVTLGGDGLEASHVPLLLYPAPGPHGRLLGHLAKANPQWRRCDAAAEALAVFQGPQAYVTPAWYPTKAATGKVVPTWNYVAVHARGRLRLITERAALLAHVERLTGFMEGSRDTPWSVSDAPEAYIDAMLRGIVGIEIEIMQLHGKWKMSQNRPVEDRVGVVHGLTAGAPEQRAVAEAMQGR